MNDCYLVDTDIIIYWLTSKYPQVDHRMKQAGG